MISLKVGMLLLLMSIPIVASMVVTWMMLRTKEPSLEKGRRRQDGLE